MHIWWKMTINFLREQNVLKSPENREKEEKQNEFL